MLKIEKKLLLEPTEHKFENHGVFNPACITDDGKIHLFYRATSKGNFSTIGYCRMNSPTEVGERYDKPLLIPQESYESQGIEDPRVVKIDDTFYISYTAYDGSNALGALVTSKDLQSFNRAGIITPKMTYKEFQLCIESCEGISEKYLRFVKLFYERGGYDTVHKLLVWDKDVVFFPKKIKGKYAFLHRIYPDIQIVYYNDLTELNEAFWREYIFNIKDYTILESKMKFEASYLGAGCPPIETDHGWLLVYHGVEDSKTGYIYHAGAALLDLEDPTKEIGRLREPFFSPELTWEKEGVVNNVVFPTGAIIENDTLHIYYGAADKRIGVASVNIHELINKIKQS